MKTLLALLAFTLFTSQAMAQKIVYACQYTYSGGLTWEKGKWAVTRFIANQPFFISATNDSIEQESLAKNLDTSLNVFCHKTTLNVQTCLSRSGTVLTFDFSTLNGTKAHTLGGTQPNSVKDKDDLIYSTFTCTKM